MMQEALRAYSKLLTMNLKQGHSTTVCFSLTTFGSMDAGTKKAQNYI